MAPNPGPTTALAAPAAGGKHGATPCRAFHGKAPQRGSILSEVEATLREVH